MNRYPLRRIGKDLDDLRANIKSSHPIFKDLSLTQIDNIIAKEFYQNVKLKKRFFNAR